MTYSMPSPNHNYMNIPDPSALAQSGSTASPSGYNSTTPMSAHLSPSAAVFQPGASKTGNMLDGGNSRGGIETQQAVLNPVSLNGSNRSAPPPRLGLNPNAPSFNAFRPASRSPGGLMPPMPFTNQPVSPLSGGAMSPNLSVMSTSPNAGMIGGTSPFPQNWGLGTPQSANGARPVVGRRGSRGAPVNQPLKTTGHNSKPSVSLNPAALSMMLAAQKPKRKVIVKLPRETGDSEGEDGAVLEQDSIAERGEGEDEEQDSILEEQQRRVRSLRQRWPKRQPLLGVDVNEKGTNTPMRCIASCEVYPEPEQQTGGLPEFIDIYLPGKSAWDEVKEQFMQEKMERDEKRVEDYSSSPGSSREAHSTLGELDLPEEPKKAAEDESGPNEEEEEEEEEEKEKVSALPLLTPCKLPKQDFLTPSRSGGSRHSSTMSLSMPSSGKPFGPSTLTALGLPSPNGEKEERSYSDSEDVQEPALGERPKLERKLSDRPFNGESHPNEELGSTWKDLGRGFGYDVEEVGESHTSGAQSSQTIPHDNVPLLQRGVHPDSSEHNRRDSWQDQRRRISGVQSDESENDYEEEDGDNEDEDEDEDDSDLDDTKSMSEEFSNPSDEEAAREARIHRRAIRAEERAAQAIAKQRERRLTNRARSGTGETFASSNINAPGEEIEYSSRRYSIIARGPLDDDGDEHEMNEGWNDQARRNPNTFTPQAPNLSRGLSQQSSQGFSALHPNAAVFAPKDSLQSSSSHFRLPSIKNSSFGSTFSQSNKGGLSATAPSFTPGAFTFTAPGGAPRLPTLAYEDGSAVTGRDSQGREKRQRQRNNELGMEAIEGETSSSPPRLQPSAASIEGPLRNVAGTGNPPPFNSHDRSYDDYRKPQGTLGTFSFKPTAAPFYPTLERGSSSRPTIPSFDPIDAQDGEKLRESDHLLDYPEQDQENANGQMLKSYSDKSSAGKKVTPLSERWQQLPTSSLDVRRSSSSSRLNKLNKVVAQQETRGEANSNDSEGDGDNVDDDDDDDDDTVSDIIEELGDRMDKALEGWAGKILDEVTIMGQVRPVNMVTLDAFEKKSLVELISNEIQEVIGTHYQQLTDSLDEINTRQAKLLEISTVGDDSTMTVTSHTKAIRGGSVGGIGHGSLDAQGELDFDYVQDTLDQKISNMQRDLSAAFNSALPKAMESIAKQVRETVNDAKLNAIVHQLEEYGTILSSINTSKKEIVANEEEKTTQSPVAEVGTGDLNLSTETTDAITALLIGRLQPVLQEATDNGTMHRRAELTDVLEPILEEHLARSQAKSKADRQDITQSLTDLIDTRMVEWGKTINDLQDNTRDQMHHIIVQSILPHFESLQSDQSNVDGIAAKVSEILLPAMTNNHATREGKEEVLFDEKETGQGIAQVVLEHLQPHLTKIGSPSTLSSRLSNVDEDDFIQRMTKAVLTAREGQEDMVDLNAVIALLEPLVAKQEESRNLSKKIIEGQHEMENTLDELPSAVNAKLEIFLTTTQMIQEAHTTIVEKLNSMSQSVASRGGENVKDGEEQDSDRVRLLEQSRDELLQQIEQVKSSEMELRGELNASHVFTNTLKEESSRLETRLDQAERDALENAELTSQLRRREQESMEKSFLAERKVVEREAKNQEYEALLKASEEQIQLLRNHIEQLATEASSSRDERAREREVAAQATAEALASRREAEESLLRERKLIEEWMNRSRETEIEAKRQVEGHLERASKAEGQVSMLEKRISEQDVKITNLQQLTATQKQKAAQGGQKLSEVEKKLKEFEGKDRELMIAHTRLSEMETRLRDKEVVEVRWRESQENEGRLREEVAMNQARFLDVERDLMVMKETLVDRESLEQAQNELANSREEIALLRGQLAESQRRESQQRLAALAPPPLKEGGQQRQPSYNNKEMSWDQSPSHGSSTWASIHAPNSSTDDMDPTRPSYIDDSFDSVGGANRSLSRFSTSRVVEVNDDGWWS